jgi:hypothetical protein
VGEGALPRKGEYRQWIDQMLAGEPTEVMFPEGFGKRGTVFGRTTNGVRQAVRFDLVVRPNYARDAAQLVFNVDISVPSADAIYRQSVDRIPDMRVPYFVREAGDRFMDATGGLWLFRDERHAGELGREVAQVLRQRVVPFLSARATITGLASELEAEINGMIRDFGYLQGDRAVYVAALHASVGSVDEARALLARAYPAGSRGRDFYDSAIEYYSSNCL